MGEQDIGELAHGDENRCGYTVHANGDWGDYRCELTVEHSGPHAIGLRHHAVPLIIALESKLEKMERALCTCPWPEDAMKTRHLLSCKLMQLEHVAARSVDLNGL